MDLKVQVIGFYKNSRKLMNLSIEQVNIQFHVVSATLRYSSLKLSFDIFTITHMFINDWYQKESLCPSISNFLSEYEIISHAYISLVKLISLCAVIV